MKYYTLYRPPMMGTIPRGFTSICAYDERTFIPEIGRAAWGYVVYDRELTTREIDEYELERAVRDD